MKYLFILGRNIELAKQEVLSYFEKENNPVLNYAINKNGMLIEVKDIINPKIIDNFGGILSIGQVLVFDDFSRLEKNLDKEMIYLGKENKLNYVVWNFSENYSFIQNYLKVRFREEKIKSTEKHLNGRMEMQDGSYIEIPSSKQLDEKYFLFQEGNRENFGKIIIDCDYDSLEKRDMQKPVRREELAISPRLAKIMINLAQIKSGETLLDPFCGVGTILQEALLQDINVIGIDKDKKAILGAKENMKWFKFDPKKYELINFDSTKVDIKEVSAIATEPDLGEILKKIPTRDKAEKILKDYENLMVNLIRNIKVKKRIIFTSPNIRIGKKRLSCNIENICERTNCVEVIPGIEEYRPNQVVGRKIFILKKSN